MIKTIKRQMVSIQPEEIEKMIKIEQIRTDLRDYNISKKVHLALQEWFKENLKSQESIANSKLPQCSQTHLNLSSYFGSNDKPISIASL